MKSCIVFNAAVLAVKIHSIITTVTNCLTPHCLSQTALFPHLSSLLLFGREALMRLNWMRWEKLSLSNHLSSLRQTGSEYSTFITEMFTTWYCGCLFLFICENLFQSGKRLKTSKASSLLNLKLNLPTITPMVPIPMQSSDFSMWIQRSSIY